MDADEILKIGDLLSGVVLKPRDIKELQRRALNGDKTALTRLQVNWWKTHEIIEDAKYGAYVKDV